MEESTVYVSANTKPRKCRRKGTTSAQKQDENERDCVKRCARTINCNFSHGDLLLTPKYDGAGWARLETWAKEHQGQEEGWEDALLRAAEREGRLYLERIKRALESQGITCRWMLFTSDMDGETGELVRPHHHLILPRVVFEVAAAKWDLGTVDYQILRDQDDYTPLAEYLCRQVRRRPDAKKWSCSRNLKKPIVSTRWAKPEEELRPDPKAVLVERNQWEPGKPQYIRFVKRPLPSERTFPNTARRAGAGATSDGNSGPEKKRRRS